MQLWPVFTPPSPSRSTSSVPCDLHPMTNSEDGSCISNQSAWPGLLSATGNSVARPIRADRAIVEDVAFDPSSSRLVKQARLRIERP